MAPWQDARIPSVAQARATEAASPPGRFRAVAGLLASWEWLVLGGILALAFVVRLSGLDTDDYRLDEPQSLETASMAVPDLVREAANEDTHPPLYYLALHVWIKAFGDSPLGLRSLSVLCGLVAVAAVFLIGRELAGPRVGVLASVLLALSAFHADYSQEARNYGMLAATSGLSFLFYLVALRRPGWAAGLGYVLATVAVLYTHVYGLFVLLAQAVLLAIRLAADRPSVDVRRWCVLLGVPSLLYVPWLVVLARQTGEEVEGGADANLDWLPEPALRWLPGTLARYAGSLWALGVVAAVLALALALRLRRSAVDLRAEAVGQRVLVPVVWIGCVTLVPFVLSFVVVPIYQVKYTIAGSLAFALLVAIALDSLPGRAVRAAATAAVVAASAVTLWQWHDGDRAYWRGFEAAPLAIRKAEPFPGTTRI